MSFSSFTWSTAYLHESATRSELVDGGWHFDKVQHPQRRRKVIGVLRLAPVVQLVENRRTYLPGLGTV